MIAEKLKKIFLKDPSRPLFWIVLGVIIKTIPLLFLLHNRPPSDMPGIWAATNGDTHGYIEPIENLLKTGTYFPDYRVPGYGFTYLVFRLIFSKTIACNLLILFQFILAGISVYYLALTAKNLFKSDRIFYTCFYAFLISTYSNFYDGWLLAESLCCSSLIFSIWFFVKYFQSGKDKHLLFSGLLLTWAISLRPVYLPIILAFAFILVITRKETANKHVGKGLILLILPVFIAELGWIAKNYQKHHELIVVTSLQESPSAATPYRRPLFNFIHSWGGSTDFTDNNAPTYWFGFHLKTMSIPKDYHDSLPENIYTSQFNKDSLLKIKTLITALCDSTLTLEKRNLYQTTAIDKLEQYRQSMRVEKPFLYYIEGPFFHDLPRLLFGPEVKFYTKRFQLAGILSNLSEGVFTLFYYLVILVGSVGMIILSWKGLRGKRLLLIVPLIPIYTIVVHALVLRVTSNRFLIPAWSFLLVSAIYVIVSAYQRIGPNAPSQQ